MGLDPVGGGSVLLSCPEASAECKPVGAVAQISKLNVEGEMERGGLFWSLLEKGRGARRGQV